MYLTVQKVLVYQALLILLVSGIFLLINGVDEGMAGVMGGAAAFIPNLYFAFKMKRVAGQQAKKILRSFYLGESGKLILTALLFVMIFQIPGLKILPLMVTYMAALSVFWFALLMR